MTRRDDLRKTSVPLDYPPKINVNQMHATGKLRRHSDIRPALGPPGLHKCDYNHTAPLTSLLRPCIPLRRTSTPMGLVPKEG